MANSAKKAHMPEAFAESLEGMLRTQRENRTVLPS
jgi:hypothetical protein